MSAHPETFDDPFGEPMGGPSGGPSGASGPARGPKLYKVGELTRVIKARLEDLGRVSVEGEVTRITRAASGHLYFSLKDIDAKIDCTIWKSQVASAIRFELAEGMQVIAHGKLDVYGPRGTYTLNVSRLEQAGLGALLVKLEELKARLKEQGWFDRHRPLPSLPRVIGVVTSRDGAAFQDFLRTRSLRWPLYPLRLAHTSVQGTAAAAEIAAAIARLDKSGVDVIVVTRGGGSMEDLWAFNEMPVLDALRAATVPVVSGIGHETDVTLADLVADHRAHTPTDAAQTVIPDRAALVEELERAQNLLLQAIDGVLEDRAARLERARSSPALRGAGWLLDERKVALESAQRALRSSIGARLERSITRIEQSARRLQRQSPAVVLERLASRVEQLGPRLATAIARPLEMRERRVGLAERSLESTSPFRVLARGYSITRKMGSKTLLVDADTASTGDAIETILAAGSLVSRVERVQTQRDELASGNS